MEAAFEKRRYVRLHKSFEIKLKIIRTSAEIDGFTDDLSQGGAFVSSPSWSAVEEDDKAAMLVFLPPEFTGQRHTVILTGPATVKRVESGREGIAVEFLKELRTFELVSQEGP